VSSGVQSRDAFAYGVTGSVAAAAPAFADAHARMVRATERDEILPPARRHLIGLAVNAAATHLHPEAVRAHVEGALEHGATDEEIVDVLQLASCLGMHTLVHGAPRLVAAAPELVADELSPRQQAIKDEWLQLRGYWPEAFDGVLAGDVAYFEACSDLQNAPFGDTIDDMFRELIFVAIDASTTHMYANVDRHIRLALEYGATPQQVLATLELTALIGVQCFTIGVEALQQAKARLAGGQGSGTQL
jgi:alkylhydroperoxidase/carboxymuconolactone decarboxylase family protein YurZ